MYEDVVLLRHLRETEQGPLTFRIIGDILSHTSQRHSEGLDLNGEHTFRS